MSVPPQGLCTCCCSFLKCSLSRIPVAHSPISFRVLLKCPLTKTTKVALCPHSTYMHTSYIFIYCLLKGVAPAIGLFSSATFQFLSTQMCSLDLTSPSPRTALLLSSPWQQNLLAELTGQLDLNCQRQSPPPVLSWTLSLRPPPLFLLQSPATGPVVNPRCPGSSYLSDLSSPAPPLQEQAQPRSFVSTLTLLVVSSRLLFEIPSTCK